MDITKYLEEMLANGMTVDEISKQAQETATKMTEEKAAAEKRKSEIAKARTAHITAYLNYLYALTGQRPKGEVVADFARELVNMEKELEAMAKRNSNMDRKTREEAIQDIFDSIYNILAK